MNWSPLMFDAPWLPSPIKAPELGATCNRLKAVRATSRAAATVIWQGSRTSAPAARPRVQRRAHVRADHRTVRTDETFCSFSRQVKLCDAELRAL